MIAASKQWKNPSNHYNHYNIDSHIDEEGWKLHIDLKSKKNKKDTNKILTAINSCNEIESSSDMDENIVYISMHKWLNLSILHQ